MENPLENLVNGENLRDSFVFVGVDAIAKEKWKSGVVFFEQKSVFHSSIAPINRKIEGSLKKEGVKRMFKSNVNTE